MHLIKLWIWICPLVLVATVIVNVYLLSSLHVTKLSGLQCETAVEELIDNSLRAVAFHRASTPKLHSYSIDPSKLIVIGKKRPTKGFLTIGVPSIRRVNGPAYLLETLASLSEHTSASEKSDVSVVVFLADLDAAYNNETATAILKQHREDIAAGFISIIRVSASHYPELGELKRNFGDAPDRVRWRAKQVVDYSVLFAYSADVSEYYVQLEDDIQSAVGFVHSVRHYIGEQDRAHPEWIVLDFSELGFIGKLFRSSELDRLAEFMMMFYVEQPVDWLIRYFKLAVNQQHTFMRKPTIFQHFGVKSSFDLSKENVLKDRFFDPGDSPISNADNPPATVVSTMPHYQDHIPELAYTSGTGYFWATKAVVGDSLQIVFDATQNLSRVVIRTGNDDHPTDSLISGHVFAGPSASVASGGAVSCDVTESVASFQNGVAMAEHLETVLPFRVKCVKVTVEADHDHWVLFASVAVFLNK